MARDDRIEKYDWRIYSNQSDKKYEIAARDLDISLLADHNIISGCSEELEFVFRIAELYGIKLQFGRALDICCGSGSMSNALRLAGFSPTGIDFNVSAIEIASRLFPHCNFICGDACNPNSILGRNGYTMILAREAHPFSRIDDWSLQWNIINDYLSLLCPGGVMIIAHARRGGGMYFPALDFSRLKRTLDPSEYITAGPYSYFLMKHLRYIPRHYFSIKLLSGISRILQYILNQRWIEFFFIFKLEAPTK